MHPLTLELSNDDQIPLFDTLSRSSHLFLNRGATGGIGSWRERPHTDGSASQQWQAAQHLPAAKFFSAGNRQQLPPFLPLSRLGAGNSRQALLATSFFSPRSLMPFRGLTAWSTYRSASSPPALFLHPPHRCSRRLRRRQMIGMVPASKVSACRLLRQGHGDWTHGRVRTTVAVGRGGGGGGPRGEKPGGNPAGRPGGGAGGFLVFFFGLAPPTPRPPDGDCRPYASVRPIAMPLS